jgi:hypothetical protein
MDKLYLYHIQGCLKLNDMDNWDSHIFLHLLLVLPETFVGVEDQVLNNIHMFVHLPQLSCELAR